MQARGLLPSQRRNRLQLNHKKSSGLAVQASEPESGNVEEVDAVIGSQNVLERNPAFAAVFKGALQRRGKDALTRNTRPADEV